MRSLNSLPKIIQISWSSCLDSFISHSANLIRRIRRSLIASLEGEEKAIWIDLGIRITIREVTGKSDITRIAVIGIDVTELVAGAIELVAVRAIIKGDAALKKVFNNSLTFFEATTA